MTDTNEKQWTVWYSIKDWFSNLFVSEAEAVLDTFENNPPPDVGFQPYTGDDAEAGEG
ncbi:hypothetical protein [Oenococcus oeni]|uniref:hypothetical protein n=1 Tax=Oenococcus oeni TaxID=1247 RepID=UPI0015D66204|nr:hypothetical protein [Oenococcus oeni]